MGKDEDNERTRLIQVFTDCYQDSVKETHRVSAAVAADLIPWRFTTIDQTVNLKAAYEDFTPLGGLTELVVFQISVLEFVGKEFRYVRLKNLPWQEGGDPFKSDHHVWFRNRDRAEDLRSMTCHVAFPKSETVAFVCQMLEELVNSIGSNRPMCRFGINLAYSEMDTIPLLMPMNVGVLESQISIGKFIETRTSPTPGEVVTVLRLISLLPPEYTGPDILYPTTPKTLFTKAIVHPSLSSMKWAQFSKWIPDLMRTAHPYYRITLGPVLCRMAEENGKRHGADIDGVMGFAERITDKKYMIIALTTGLATPIISPLILEATNIDIMASYTVTNTIAMLCLLRLKCMVSKLAQESIMCKPKLGTSKKSPVPVQKKTKKLPLCLVCIKNDTLATVRMLPCNHTCMCFDCHSAVRNITEDRGFKCPECYTAITRVLTLKTN